MIPQEKLKELEGVVEAAREINDILTDHEARQEIDSLTAQPLTVALHKLDHPASENAGGA